jgi:CheY-like chemotaxis protein
MMQAQSPSERGFKKPLVMIVEDDPDLRDAMRGYLEETGRRVVTAPEGGAAMRALQSGVRPSLILLDLFMPGTDGWQFRYELMRNPKLFDIPIVVVTGRRTQEAASLFLDDVLHKPFDPKHLGAVVARYC